MSHPSTWYTSGVQRQPWLGLKSMCMAGAEAMPSCVQIIRLEKRMAHAPVLTM